MSSDVFIISAAHDRSASAAIQQALRLAGISPSHVQDAVFGLDAPSALSDAQPLVQSAGLACPAACVYTSLRAIFFAAASMLSDDAQLSVVAGLDSGPGTAFVLGSPEAVGRMNLLPRARIAARSLTGAEPALRAAEITSADIEISKEGELAAPSLYDLLEELDAKPARWGMLAVGEALILIERV